VHILCWCFTHQFQQQVVSGELTCSKEEAATLAGIQLHLDEAWPDETDCIPAEQTDEQREREHLLDDHPQRGGGGGGGRGSTSERTSKWTFPSLTGRGSTSSKSKVRRHRGWMTSRAFVCIGGESGMRSCFRLPDESMARCLPPDYRSSRSVRELIEVSVFVNEMLMRWVLMWMKPFISLC